jgi:chaperone modulatory protein CbpM
MQRLATIELKEVATLCQLDEAELFELVEYGAITVIENEMNGTCISSDCIDTLQKAAQIRHDFVLDLFTMAILMNFIQKITDLEKTNLRLLSEASKCVR